MQVVNREAGQPSFLGELPVVLVKGPQKQLRAKKRNNYIKKERRK